MPFRIPASPGLMAVALTLDERLPRSRDRPFYVDDLQHLDVAVPIEPDCARHGLFSVLSSCRKAADLETTRRSNQDAPTLQLRLGAARGCRSITPEGRCLACRMDAEAPMGMTERLGDASSVAVLGTGIMGSAMARRLAQSGLRTIAWDRTPSASAALANDGVEQASTPQEAVREARVVVTMLPTADVVEAVIFGEGALQAFSPGAVWAQMGTIGVAETERIAARTAELRPDVRFVDAPVSGSRGPAGTGHLLILASGPPDAAAVMDAAFSAIGRRTVWLGPAGQGSV